MTRPRSPQVHERVIRAALKLFAEQGIDAASISAIAVEAGVSKATIYKYWPAKEALLLEVMLFVNGLGDEPEDVDSGYLPDDLTTVLARRPPGEFDQARNRMMPGLIAYSAVHPAFGDAWRHRVMEPPRQCLRRILRRAVLRGLLRYDLDPEFAIALLLGPMLYRHIFFRDATGGHQEFSRLTAEAFCRAFEPRQPPGTRFWE